MLWLNVHRQKQAAAGIAAVQNQLYPRKKQKTAKERRPVILLHPVRNVIMLLHPEYHTLQRWHKRPIV
jgi:hypothetical protein